MLLVSQELCALICLHLYFTTPPILSEVETESCFRFKVYQLVPELNAPQPNGTGPQCY